jgi:hypothetical protein
MTAKVILFFYGENYWWPLRITLLIYFYNVFADVRIYESLKIFSTKRPG